MTQKSDDKTSFSDLVAGVKKLKNDRINTYQHRAKKPPASRGQSGDSMADFSSIEHRQLSELQDSYFNSGITKKLQRKIRQGILPIDDELDLHGFNQQQSITELTRFLDHALSMGLKMLIIIHGKGQGSGGKAVLKPLVQHWLAQQASVLAWCPTQANHGGSGASYVYLRAG